MEETKDETQARGEVEDRRLADQGEDGNKRSIQNLCGPQKGEKGRLEEQKALNEAISESLQPNYLEQILKAEARSHKQAKSAETDLSESLAGLKLAQEKSKVSMEHFPSAIRSSSSPFVSQHPSQSLEKQHHQHHHHDRHHHHQQQQQHSQEGREGDNEEENVPHVHQSSAADARHSGKHAKSSEQATIGSQDSHSRRDIDVAEVLELNEETDGDVKDDETCADAILTRIPHEILVATLLFLDESSFARCLALSKKWAKFLQSETIWEHLCRRVYPIQSRRATKLLGRRKWATWREMFTHRPRVRYSGIYFNRWSYIKKPELNMWTEIPRGTVLEAVYYRYFLFLPDGTVLYSLNLKPPREVASLLSASRNAISLKKVEEATEPPTLLPASSSASSSSLASFSSGPTPHSSNLAKKEIFRGLFSVSASTVHVSVTLPHSTIQFRLKLGSTSPGAFNRMELLEHTFSSSPDSDDFTHLATHGQVFKFMHL